MDIYEIINHRQSDRQYDPERPVEPEKIRRILEAARIAPSACNAQPWHFIVVDEPELRNQVADAVASRILGMNHFDIVVGYSTQPLREKKRKSADEVISYNKY